MCEHNYEVVEEISYKQDYFKYYVEVKECSYCSAMDYKIIKWEVIK